MTYIINIATIKSTAGLSNLVEDRRFAPFMDGVHRTVKKMLGETLYDRLIEAIEDDPTLATEADLKTLVDDYLTGYIAWTVYLSAMPRLYAEFDRNGAHFKNDGNTVQADGQWLKMEQAMARDMADKYSIETFDYLKDNSDTGEPFEDWKTVTADEQGQRINRSYGVGIITRPSRWQRSQR